MSDQPTFQVYGLGQCSLDCLGKIEAASKAAYLEIIDELAQRGAEAVILGCTEIGLLVEQSDTAVKLLDTTAIHATRAVEYSLS